MEKRPLTANELRRLAEAVDGIRDEPAYVVWSGGEPMVKKQLDDADELIVECETNNDVRHRSRLKSITLDPPMVDQHRVPVTDLSGQYDAMFWSEAAVEKFVIPYYAGFNNAADLARIEKSFNHPSVYAMLHLPFTEVCVLTTLRTGDKGLEALSLKEFESSL